MYTYIIIFVAMAVSSNQFEGGVVEPKKPPLWNTAVLVPKRRRIKVQFADFSVKRK